MQLDQPWREGQGPEERGETEEGGRGEGRGRKSVEHTQRTNFTKERAWKQLHNTARHEGGQGILIATSYLLDGRILVHGTDKSVAEGWKRRREVGGGEQKGTEGREEEGGGGLMDITFRKEDPFILASPSP